MKPASYSVLRYIADPGRNEPLNIGIVVCDQAQFRLGLDELAVARIVRENPHLPEDSLFHLERALTDRILSARDEGSTVAQRIQHMIDCQSGFPWQFSEMRYTTLQDGGSHQGADGHGCDDAMEETFSRLLKRIVHPQRRSTGGGISPVVQLGHQLRPFLNQRAISANYRFRAISGRERSVDFFANSTANIAVDAISLAVKDADEILRRADAEAFKISDINRPDIKFLLYCRLHQDKAYDQASETARLVLESVGARVETQLETTMAAIKDAIARK